MKKILSLLGSILVISSSSSTMVSCTIPSDDLTCLVNGTSLSEDDIKSYKIDTMSDVNPFFQVATQVLNLVSMSPEKTIGEKEAAYIGDAKEMGLDYALNTDVSPYYSFKDASGNESSDLKSNFKSAFRSAGNSRFTSVDYIFSDSTNYSRNISSSSIASAEVSNSNSSDITLEKTNLKAISEKITDDTKKTNFKKVTDTFDNKKIPFVSSSLNNSSDVKFSLKSYTSDTIKDKDVDKSSTSIQLSKDTNIEIPFVATTDSSDDKKTTITPYANYCPFYYEETESFEIDLHFESSAGEKFLIDVNVPSFYLFYRVNLIQSAAGLPDDDAYVFFLAPIGFQFNESISDNINKKDGFKSFVNNGFNATVTKEN